MSSALPLSSLSIYGLQVSSSAGQGKSKSGTLPHLQFRQAQYRRQLSRNFLLHFRTAAASMLTALACRIPVREFLTTIEKLSASDITKAASAMLKSPVSMASLGNVVDIPRYPEMQKRFS